MVVLMHFSAVSVLEAHGPRDVREAVAAGRHLSTLAFSEAMSYADPQVRPLLELEGLRVWREGRTSGYAQLERAVDAVGFYDAGGRVTAAEYAP
jgi:hypothetical protein